MGVASHMQVSNKTTSVTLPPPVRRKIHLLGADYSQANNEVSCLHVGASPVKTVRKQMCWRRVFENTGVFDVSSFKVYFRLLLLFAFLVS